MATSGHFHLVTCIGIIRVCWQMDDPEIVSIIFGNVSLPGWAYRVSKVITDMRAKCDYSTVIVITDEGKHHGKSHFINYLKKAGWASIQMPVGSHDTRRLLVSASKCIKKEIAPRGMIISLPKNAKRISGQKLGKIIFGIRNGSVDIPDPRSVGGVRSTECEPFPVIVFASHHTPKFAVNNEHVKIFNITDEPHFYTNP